MKIQLRNDTAANWTTANPVLDKGEFGNEWDTGKFKIGDGTTPWNTLPYAAGGGGSGTVTSVGLSAPSWLAVSGSPVTGAGTLSLAAAVGQAANLVLATPDGATGAVGLRALVAADIPTLNQSTTGNAATATALQTARTINGTSFNGSANITVPAAASTLTGTALPAAVVTSSLTSVGTLTTGVWSATTITVAKGGTGATTLTGLVKGNGTAAMTSAVVGTDYVVPSGSITGNAGTATTLQTARTVGMSGVTATAQSFNGSANITIPVTAVPTSLLTGALAASQFPALTGDVVTTAGALATTIAAGAVTLAKMANLAAASLIGNSSGSAATPVAITVGTGLSLVGGVLTATGTVTDPNLVLVNAQTGTAYTLVLGDKDKEVECTNAAAITVTVPPNSSVAFPLGAIVYVAQGGAGQVTLAPGAGVTLKKPGTLAARVQESTLALLKVGTDTWRVMGDCA